MSQTDTLRFTINSSKLHNEPRITKRHLLSDASKLYDPCGLLSPIIIKAKIIMQKIWKTGIDWDVIVDGNIQSEWNTYRSELPLIEQLKISLHGFCDSSEQAYAAAIYIVQKTKDGITAYLVCSKTRVPPMSMESIPRLELCGAVLLSELMECVAENLKVPKENIYLWTDSSIVLTWLNAHASRWQTYVAHRVSNIQKKYDENPADIASRGAFASELLNNNLWFHGPEWLLKSQEHWPKLELQPPTGINLEEKIRVNHVASVSTESDVLARFSNFNHLLRVTAFIMRFVNRARKSETLEYSNNFITYDRCSSLTFLKKLPV